MKEIAQGIPRVNEHKIKSLMNELKRRQRGVALEYYLDDFVEIMNEKDFLLFLCNMNIIKQRLLRFSLKDTEEAMRIYATVFEALNYIEDPPLPKLSIKAVDIFQKYLRELGSEEPFCRNMEKKLDLRNPSIYDLSNFLIKKRRTNLSESEIMYGVFANYEILDIQWKLTYSL